MRKQLLDKYLIEWDSHKLIVYDKSGKQLKTFDIFGVENDVIAIMLKSWLVGQGEKKVKLEKIKEVLFVEKKVGEERIQFIKARPGEELKGKEIPKLEPEVKVSEIPVQETTTEVVGGEEVKEGIEEVSEEAVVEEEEEKKIEIPPPKVKDKITLINLTKEPFQSKIIKFLIDTDLELLSTSELSVSGSRTYLFKFSDNYGFSLNLLSPLAKKAGDLVIFGSELVILIVDGKNDFEYANNVFFSEMCVGARKELIVYSADTEIIDLFKQLVPEPFTSDDPNTIIDYVVDLLLDYAKKRDTELLEEAKAMDERKKEEKEGTTVL